MIPGDDRSAQAGIHRFAARVFVAEVDEPLLGRLREAGAGFPEPLLPGPGGDGPVPEVLDELAAQYCGLFVGPEPLCPPYLSARGAGRPEVLLRDFAHRAGLSLPDPRALRVAAPNHAGVVLAVLAELCECGPEDDRAEFARLFVDGPLAGFVDGVVERAPPGLYRSTARAVRIAMDRDPPDVAAHR